ncbi:MULTISPECIES: GntR family transcriptional regulator [Peribacillus]|uniref:GntR family transcriptional regulator n=1 Tax=Peribacillus TaxID=2675229 RepID=UPI001F4DE0A0|nr:MULTISPECIES: GntR family transcriptional regulator [unclassified Peribacillus]MCK1985614.1 GntR family transcriptional regulator [Peribacillus sp. Aquil_B1]MCK2009370.1 GntR family transcriptional regulator [Peribacillus sp. Aquil_B8]
MGVKYRMVVEQMEKEIVEGKYTLETKLPTEEELMKKFDVSRNTIRKAINILVEQGYIYQVQGSGIFLREFSRPGCISMRDMSGLTKVFPNDEMKSKVLKLELIEADEKLAKQMKCQVKTKIYNLKRVRYLNGEPIVIEESFFNKDIIPIINNEIANGSIYEYIVEDLKLNIGFADKIISCEKLNDDDAKLLDLQPGDPTLIVESTVFLKAGAVFDLSIEKYNYTSAKLLTLT